MKYGDSFLERRVERLAALYDRFGRAGLKEAGFNEVCLVSMVKTQELDGVRAQLKADSDDVAARREYVRLRLELLDLKQEVEERDAARQPQHGNSR